MSPPGGGSRLQKLLKLLDGGPSLETRKAAARQIAGIAASHPAQLPSVITQIAVHLKHRDWDARVAAAHCLGLLADHFAHPSVADLCVEAGVDMRQLDCVKQETPAAGSLEEATGPSTLRFDTFNVAKVLEQGTSLLASWGEEFDEAVNGGSNLTTQRQNLKKRLGLGCAMDAFVDTSDMIQDEDLLAVAAAPKRGSKRQGSVGGGSKRGASPAVAPPQIDAQQLLADMSGLSARERAAALRRAKSGLKRGLSGMPSAELGSPTKKAKVAGGAGAAAAGGPAAEGVAAAGDGGEAATEDAGLSAEHEWQELLAGRWPFQTLCDQLCLDVLHPLWEVRHGAAMALREILRTHAAAAGVHAPVSADPSGWVVAGGSGKQALGHVSGFDAAAAHASNLAWAEDCAIHLVCVLALDRFGDFLSDQVVAPVRETAAQALGAATRPLPPAALGALLSSLRQLSECSEWEVRHGGLLGLKYVLAARGGAAAGDGGIGSNGGSGSGSQAGADLELLQAVLPAALVGLRDKDDDVRAVAAEALLPVAPQLALDASPAAQAVRRMLWDILLTLEDLSPATASVMILLAQMYSSLGTGGASSARALAEVKSEPRELIKAEPGDSSGADVAPVTKQETTSADGTSTATAATSSQLGLAAAAQERLGNMVPRLWPFLRHGLTSVRLAAVRCLTALLRAFSGLLAGNELVRALRLVFQNLLLERNEEVLAESQAAWQLLVRSRASQQLRSDLQAAPASAAAGKPPGGSGGGMVCDVLGVLCQLAATPTGATLASALLLAVPPPAGKGSSASLGPSPRKGAADLSAAAAGGGQQQDSLVVGGDNEPGVVARMRLAAAQALGQLAQALHSPDGSPNPMLPHVLSCLRAGTASGRLVGALTTTAWAREAQQSTAQQQATAAGAETAAPAVGAATLPDELQQVLPVLLELLSAPVPGAQAPYAELASLYVQLRSQAQAVVARGTAAGVALALPQPVDALSAEGALALAAQVPAAAPSDLDLGRQALQGSAAMVQSSEALLHTSVCSALAVAVVQLGALPAKLNSVIQPLVAAVRREPEPLLQGHAAVGLARLCLLCAPRTPCPNDKVIKNLCAFACGDPAATPSAAQPPMLDVEDVGEGGPGPSTSKAAKEKNGTAATDPQQDLNAQAQALARRGGEATLQQLARDSGTALLATLPRLWDQMTTPLTTLALAAVQPHQSGTAPPAPPPPQQQQQPGSAQPQLVPEQQQPAVSSPATVSLVDPASLQPAVNALHVLRVVGPDVHQDLLPHLLALLPLISLCSQHPNAALKLAAACCFAALAAAHTQPVMPHLLRLLTPLMAGGAPESSRVGALLAARQLIRALGLRLVPYVLLLVVPLIGRMSDASPLARGLASACFASVVALVPLMDRSLRPPPGLDEAQLATWRQEGGFLAQLLDNSAAEDYQLPIPINGTLRRYQQEGINWLAFLRRFGLHGVLADDMGLGKTLQATSIIAATMFEQRAKYAQTGLPPDAPRPSLIVCPSTLVAHWPYEIHKFVGLEGPGGLRVLQYQGSPGERAALRVQLAAHDVVVMAYESVRADVEWISGVEWGYCVLDEGHTIRNPASKITQACKRVRAQHRVILSGTPIQNNVLELWSLFDFLMPGFLGSERQFNAKYGKAVQTAKATASKRGASNAAAGVLALEGLHRQVMPFILRRTKDQVLKDLPPKIIQDVLCEPSPLQKALYEDFAQGQVVQQISGVVQGGTLGDAAQPDKAPHVFSALLYLRKLCSHPLLVLDPKQPQHLRALAAAVGHPPTPRAGAGAAGVDLEWARAQLHSHLCHAPKLLALQELLLDCGIGREPGTKGDANGIGGVGSGDEGSSAGHRVLVFAQLKAVLDLVETDVLAPLGVSSLRIDGGVDSAERFRRVQQFNADPTIDVMLLTTQVGGLGLNLTAADTVIFLEHDWNPMKDLQAMDRAHRLGQQRVVNVYRLLVRGTLEEQILSLQRFKLDVAATLVNQDNVSLAAMDTSHLLDLFAAQEAKQQAQPQKAGGEEGAAPSKGKKSGLQAMLDSLGDISQNEEQYAQEFSLASFQSRMAKGDT